jgi:hypothetical protein
LRFGFWSLGFTVRDLGFAVCGLELRVWGLGSRVGGLGFRGGGVGPRVAPPCVQLRRPHFVIWIRVPSGGGEGGLYVSESGLGCLTIVLTVFNIPESGLHCLISGLDCLICVRI